MFTTESKFSFQVNDNLDGLVIPGGESTVMRKYLKEHDFQERLASWIRMKTKAILNNCEHEISLTHYLLHVFLLLQFTWGTCAGLIVLSNRIVDNNVIVSTILSNLCRYVRCIESIDF